LANEGDTADIICAMVAAMDAHHRFVATYLSIVLRNNGRYFGNLLEMRLLCSALTFRDFVPRLEPLTLFRDMGIVKDFPESIKMCKMNYFSLFCKSYLVLFSTFIMALRFYAAATQI